MMRLYVATGDALAVLTRRDGVWRAELRLQGLPTHCVAVDPLRPELVYCGTFGRGLWRSGDGGGSWEPAGAGIAYDEVMAVAVSPSERDGGARGVLWAGTEPSALFRSEDGGQTWRERPALRDIPSSPTWSFPPRPWTHHVRWIQPDPQQAERLFVAIELGGVMCSRDGGLTWEDRKPGAKLDAHTLAAHRLAPGRVYEAAGDGYAESGDGGTSWQGGDEGLAWTYLWGMAIDPADPDTVVISASPGPRHAHDRRWAEPSVAEWHARGDAGRASGSEAPPEAAGSAAVATGPGAAVRSAAVPGSAPHRRGGPPPWAGYTWRGPEAWLYRRAGAGPWHQLSEGLPQPRASLAYVLATHEAEPHVFYASPQNGAIYRSADAGRGWEALAVRWPDGYEFGRVNGLAAAPAD